ncbi:unnamed protein product [Mytilus coruscus]|uniref:Uncharacterized protein n=1 Tax=Mytilus coruscus TaxID=42192 RepID=A0A6J8ABM3_MYTCO|nr:unnamed protein product [Mytilus coruscus]
MLRYTILSDDWRQITCESALNAAVRKGHLRIVKLLLEKEVNALHCTMFDGSTPLMTAAKYDQAEVFRYLHDSDGNLAFRCKNNLLYKDKIEKTELDLLKEKTCPENGSISHLLTIHNSYGIIKYLLNKGFEDWDTRDSNGLTPSHYAFCCNSNNFIKFIVFADEYKVHLNLNSKSANGSTPYHSAAICKSLILSHYVDSSVRRLPDKIDNNNRSILHYGLMPPVCQKDAIRIDRVGKDYFSDLLLRVTINNRHDYLRKDNDGRNLLHYAASSGNYWVFLKILQILSKEDIRVLLYCNDKSRNTPLKEAFNSLTPRQAFESLKIPFNCSLSELFSTTLLKTYAPKEFNAIVSSSIEIPTILAKSDIHIIAEYIFNADNSLRCNKTESPLHQLVLNAMSGQDILPLNLFLIPLFKKFSSQYLDECYDENGYNLLHRAAMGGNIQTVELLSRKGMNVSCPSKYDDNTIELCISSSPFLKNGQVPSYYVSGPRFHVIEYVFQSETLNVSYDRKRNVDFDSTAEFLVGKMSTYLVSEYMGGRENKNVIDVLKNKLPTTNGDFKQLFALSHMTKMANIIRRQLLLFSVDDGEFFYRYLQTRGKDFEKPLSDNEII